MTEKVMIGTLSVDSIITDIKRKPYKLFIILLTEAII